MYFLKKIQEREKNPCGGNICAIRRKKIFPPQKINVLQKNPQSHNTIGDFSCDHKGLVLFNHILASIDDIDALW